MSADEPQRDESDGDIEPSEGGVELDRSEIDKSARDVERLKGHSESFDDSAGVTPTRSQQSRTPRAD
jgi:hypothetical protein